MNYQDVLLFEAPIPIACVDMELNFIGANDRFLQLFNVRDGLNLKGRSLFHFIESLEILSKISEFIKGDYRIFELEHKLLVKRHLKHVRFQFKKISAPLELVAIYVEDLTVVYEKNQEVDALRASSFGASRMAILGEMASGIAHEINNPLQVISGVVAQTQRIISKKSETTVSLDEVSSKLIKIKSTTQKIEKIVRGLKAYARDSSGDPFQSNLVVNLINDSLELCSDKLKHHEINLIIDEIDPSIQLDCRGSQISQVLLNLISNAKDAIKDQKNADKWIKVSAKDTGSEVEFILTDSGKGISPEVSEKILQPFFTTKANGEGTGLGLTISKKIIESHSGKLTIDKDRPNTTFVFTIPKGLGIQA